MAKVLVDEDQIKQLGVVIGMQRKSVDSIFTRLGEMRDQIAKLTAAQADEADLSPLLDEANAVEDLLTGIGTPDTTDAPPVPTPDVPPADDATPLIDNATPLSPAAN